MRQNKLFITPEMCRAGYEYFRTTLPYRRWRLHAATRVAFVLPTSAELYGSVFYPAGVGSRIKPRMEVSDHRNWCTDVLMRTLAHEMLHLRQFQLDGWRIVDNDKEYGHGPDFQAMAKLVCRRHGFNLETF